MNYERRCWTCDDIMAWETGDGIARLVCPTCGPKVRRGRPRTQRGMRAARTSERASYGMRTRKV